MLPTMNETGTVMLRTLPARSHVKIFAKERGNRSHRYLEVEIITLDQSRVSSEMQYWSDDRFSEPGVVSAKVIDHNGDGGYGIYFLPSLLVIGQPIWVNKASSGYNGTKLPRAELLDYWETDRIEVGVPQPEPLVVDLMALAPYSRLEVSSASYRVSVMTTDSTRINEHGIVENVLIATSPCHSTETPVSMGRTHAVLREGQPAFFKKDGFRLDMDSVLDITLQ